jgi:dTDP-4-dehydrorhamnose 3,5-epimerase
MEFLTTSVSGCFEIGLKSIQDNRGQFSRVFCRREFENAGIQFNVAQSNFAKTMAKGTLRGFHYQIAPKTEAKLVRVERGSIFDVCLDLRKNSSTFGKWHGTILSADNGKMLYLPKGCAHAMLTLEDNCELVYLHDEFYSPDQDRTAHHADPIFAVKWPLPVLVISEKDQNAPLFTRDFKGIEL